MARLLKSEIYAEINAHLCGLKHLDKENNYKTQLDELEKQNRQLLLNSLTNYSAQILSKKIELLYDKCGAVGKFL